MNNLSSKSDRTNQIKSLKVLFALATVCFAFVLIIQAIYLSQSQLDYQKDMMTSVSRSVLKELSQVLETQRLKIDLFYSQNNILFNQYLNNPELVTENDYNIIYNKTIQDFPDSRLYTLISKDGINLLEHITGKFLEDCSEEVLETVSLGVQKGLFLHRSKTSTHYDLIQPLDSNNLSKGYLFIAFNIDFFNELLNKYQLPYQQLYLLRNDKKGFIEVSTQENLNLEKSSLSESRYLDETTISQFEFNLPIPNTRWSFAIKLGPKAKTNLLYQALKQSLFTWIIITLILYFAYRMIKNNLESKYLAESALQQSRQNASTIINAVSEAVIAVDPYLIVTFANQSATDLLKKELSDVLEKNLADVCNLYHQTKNIKQNFSDIIKLSEDINSPKFLNLTLHDENNVETPVAVKVATILNPEKQIQGYAITLESLSNAIKLSKRMAFHEMRDKLTGLYNRQSLERKIHEILINKKNETNSKNTAIALIDFDKFKLLNSSHGFEAGDEFLKRISKLLSESLTIQYPISRLSSDEFAIIFEDIDETSLVEKCTQIKEIIRNFKFVWLNEIISASVCLGVVLIDQHFNNTDEVLAAADHACRLAKSKGINITQFYQTDDPEIKQRTDEIHILVDLKKAIEEERLVLYRQEIRKIDTKNPSSLPLKYELLIRMIDINGQVISPVQFIPAAEKYGLMAKIDLWVIRNTFKNIYQLSNKDHAIYNINISSKTLSDQKIISFVEDLFLEFPISAQRINFEVTETSAISYLENALEFMHAMRSRGCTFSLDDFGTGLASFDYLKKLPIDFLKIDGVFVKDLETNPNDFAFIEAIHKISSQMGIKTVAEFVENGTILQMLETIGVDYAQGYHLHKPEPWLEK